MATRRPPEPSLSGGIAGLATRFGLGDEAAGQLETFAGMLAADPLAPTAVRDPQRVLEDHLADSLVALELECVRSARSAVDIGSGAGLPGLPLAIALPSCSFVLLDASERKRSFIARAIEACTVANAEAIQTRAEVWEPGLGRFDLALVRAVARLDVVLEYAAPLLAVGGQVVAWRGKRDAEAEVEAEHAAKILGLQGKEIRRVEPYRGAENRYLHLFSKVRGTPARFPRRPGVAAKRPLGLGRAGGRRLAR